MKSFPLPRPVREGANLAIVAPAGPFDREAFLRGVEWLQRRYEIQYEESIFSRRGYLAGADERRRDEILRALQTPEIDAIVAARGGFGTTRILPDIDLALIKEANKQIIGFSDISALHSLWAKAGVRSVHGPMVAALGNAPRPIRKQWRRTVEQSYSVDQPVQLSLDPIRAGRASGRLFGGNLAVLAALLGTPYEPPVDENTILFLEDVGERPYRIDRMLTSLRQAGWFEKISGLILGAFTEGAPGPDGVCVDEVLESHFEESKFPVLRDLSAGHIRKNLSLPFGAETRIEDNSLSIL